MKQGKIWGESTDVFSNETTIVSVIRMWEGGYSSKHKHKHRDNLFHVISGRLLIEIWQDDYSLCDKTTLRTGESCRVKAGLFHRMTAKEDTVALEVYNVKIDKGDIERETVGGK